MGDFLTTSSSRGVLFPDNQTDLPQIFIHSKMYIAPLLGKYSEGLQTPVRTSGVVLKNEVGEREVGERRELK